MIRNLKALGLALAAMLVLGAVAASAASAQVFAGELTTAEGQEVTLTGAEGAEATNALTAFGNSIECPGSTYTGHQVGTTEPHRLVPNEATEATITPHYDQEACKDSANREATVEMNSCDYDFAIGTATEGEGTYGLTTRIACDGEGDEIHIGIWAEGNEAHEESQLCTVEVGEQEVGGAHVTDNADGTLTAAGTFTGVHVERHGLCVLDGKGTTTTGAEVHVGLDIEAENAAEEAVAISLSDFDEHERETHEEETGELTTESGNPVTLIGAQNAEGTNALTAFEGRVVCPNSTYTGHKAGTTEPHQMVPNKATEVTITPHYNQEKCEDTASEFEATIEMNSCDYGFAIGETAEGEGKYGLSAAIACDTEGDEIHVGIWDNSSHEEARLCTIEVGEQEVGGAHLTNNEGGTVTAAGTLAGLEAERHGICLLDGGGTTTESAQLDIDILLGGLDAEENLVGIGVSD